LSQDAINAARDYISSQFGEKYLPKEPNLYSNKEQAQEAHEAIRPTEVTRNGDHLGDMERDAQRLYALIWKRFVACQMPPARFLSSSIHVEAGDYQLKAKGRILQFDGYLKVMSGSKDDDVHLPDINVGEELVLQKLDPLQHFTKPTARFTEASLVKELEKRGIGRPSTYASIISTIQDRGYAKLDTKRFYAEKMGEIVTDRLSESFSGLMSYDFTANMEQQLDQVSNGVVKWKQILNDFYGDFKKKLIKAESDAIDGGMRVNDPVEIEILCDKCGRPMQIRTASTGVFLGCSGYSQPPKERCTNTKNLVDGNEFIGADEDLEVEQLMSKKRCAKCSTAMESYLIDANNRLHVCGNSPDCDGYEIEKGDFVLKGYDGPSIDCDKCGEPMHLKTGRFGKYFGCTADECKNTRKLLRSGQPAPPKDDPIPMPELRCVKHEDYYLLRDGASGLFLAASQFPKNRETRAPLIKEILTVKDQLTDKFKYLLDAPTVDNEGRDTILRFSRKTKEQYVTTEVDGKATNWRAYYQDGRWIEDIGKAPVKKAPAKKPAAKKAPAKKTK
jgi:DNA topoisomerase-1